MSRGNHDKIKKKSRPKTCNVKSSPTVMDSGLPAKSVEAVDTNRVQEKKHDSVETKTSKLKSFLFHLQDIVIAFNSFNTFFVAVIIWNV